MTESIINIHWEGPYDWETAVRETENSGYVFYQIYGTHLVFGSNILFYIGTCKKMKKKLPDHDWWVLHEEYDKVSIRLGSMGNWFDWEHWIEDRDTVYPYPKRALGKMVNDAEKLLILANQPIFNVKNKATAKIKHQVRIFNTGNMGRILPEVSSKYLLER
ncbi:MAG: hypothetical protein V3U37_07175 [Nitrospinaceae bacterium]